MSQVNRSLTLDEWVTVLHANSTNAGWWDDLEDLNNLGMSNYLHGTKIALIHSEVSEMMEGMRKGSADDHLPLRSAEEVEAADVFIRLIDYCGARDLDLAGAVLDKLKYNKHRADHTREARAAAGGKKF